MLLSLAAVGNLLGALADAAVAHHSLGKLSEPAVLLLVGMGFVGLGLVRRRYSGE